MITKRAYPLFNPSLYPADKLESNDGLKKEASLSSDTTQFVDKIASDDPVAKKKIFIVNGLGASDYYGHNRNGDAFFEKHLTSKQTPAEAQKNNGELKGKCLPRYKTFVNGHAFEHHKNDDPENSIGDLLTSFWNDQMKRVEVIAKLNENKAEEVIKDYHDGKPIAWSMGCFPKGYKVKTGRGLEKPIQHVEEGERVQTHTNSETVVTEKHTRKYDDTLYSIKTAANNPIKVTKEHPWLVMDEDQLKNEYGSEGKKYQRVKDEEKINIEDANWKCSKHLKEGDYLIKPINQNVETPDYADEYLARFLGYYLAEGHVIKDESGEPTGVEFTTNNEDQIHNEIDEIVSNLNTEYDIIRRDRANTPAKALSIYDTELAMLCWEHCGEYSREKKLSRSIQLWDKELQKELIGAYMEGDGWQSGKGSHEGAIMFSTSSEDLAKQIQHMLWRNSMHCNISTNLHKEGGGKNTKPTLEYVIRIAKTSVDELVDYTTISPYGSDRRNGGQRILTEDAMYTPIKDITTIEYNGTVYNLEVESDDSSYKIEEYAVHNCKVDSDRCSKCGNRASSRKDYCKHLKENMGDILPSGEAVYAINDRPRFFDLSIVTIPADETAYTLKVVGMDKDVEPEDGTDLHEDDEFVETLKSSLDKVAENEEENEKQSDIVKEIIGIDAENMDITKVIEKFLNEEIDKEDLIKLLTCEFVGEKTARVMHEAETSVDFPIGIEDLEKQSASFEDIIKVSDDETARQLQRALSEAGAIQKGDPPLQNLSKIREEDASARRRTGMAIAGGNVIADVLQTIKQGSDDDIRKYLRGRPGITNFLLRLLAGSATGVASAIMSELTSTGTPEPVAGQISGKQN